MTDVFAKDNIVRVVLEKYHYIICAFAATAIVVLKVDTHTS